MPGSQHVTLNIWRDSRQDNACVGTIFFLKLSKWEGLLTDSSFKSLRTEETVSGKIFRLYFLSLTSSLIWNLGVQQWEELLGHKRGSRWRRGLGMWLELRVTPKWAAKGPFYYHRRNAAGAVKSPGHPWPFMCQATGLRIYNMKWLVTCFLLIGSSYLSGLQGNQSASPISSFSTWSLYLFNFQGSKPRSHSDSWCFFHSTWTLSTILVSTIQWLLWPFTSAHLCCQPGLWLALFPFLTLVWVTATASHLTSLLTFPHCHWCAMELTKVSAEIHW